MNILVNLCENHFTDSSFLIPKYLVAYHGAPMVYNAINTLNIPGDAYFVVSKTHLQEFSFLKNYLGRMGTVIEVDSIPESTVHGLLSMKDHIRDLDQPMISIAYDQYLKWNSSKFITQLESEPKYSFMLAVEKTSSRSKYIRADKNNNVIEVNNTSFLSSSTTGVYHWATTRDFMTDADSLIAEGSKDFNIALVYNYSIKRGLRVKKINIDRSVISVLDTVDDLRNFIETDYDR